MSPVAVGTIIAKNYLPFARVLVRSLRNWHPDVAVRVLVVDEFEGLFDPAAEEFPVIGLEDVGAGAVHWRFGLTRNQLVSAAKPFLLEALLEGGFERALFLDADMLVTGPLEPLLRGFVGASLLLSPHVLRPLAGPEGTSRELTILRAGVYNAGCVGASDTGEARRILRWWRERVSFRCEEDLAGGVFYDQRWLDLVPSLAADLAIVRDPGVNVAWWNAAEREVRDREGRLQALGEPCRLFHFSGFDPDRPRIASRHMPESRQGESSSMASLLRRYAALLADAGWETCRAWPYTWDRFRNGVPIPEVARRIYLDRKDGTGFGDPFATGPGTFFEWLRGGELDAWRDGGPLPGLWQDIWGRRGDLRRAFPDPWGKDRRALLEWAREFGAREHGIPPELLPGAAGSR